MAGVAVLMVIRSDWPLVTTLISVSFFLLVGCELIPKTIAIRSAELWTTRLLPLTLAIQPVLRPIQRIAQSTNERLLARLIPSSMTPNTKVTEEDYQELLELGTQSGALDNAEKEIIQAIVSLDKKTVGDVMTPKARIVSISNKLSPKEMKTAALKHRHTRLLIKDETTSRIEGVLDAQSFLLSPSSEVKPSIEFPTFIPESMNAWELLVNFQKDKRRLAVVVDEYGETAGLVTNENLLESIMGPIFESQSRVETKIERLDKGLWKVGGLTPVREFAKHYPAIGSMPEIETMGGLYVTLAAHIPRSPVPVRFRGLRIIPQRLTPTRVDELIVERITSRRK